MIKLYNLFANVMFFQPSLKTQWPLSKAGHASAGPSLQVPWSQWQTGLLLSLHWSSELKSAQDFGAGGALGVSLHLPPSTSQRPVFSQWDNVAFSVVHLPSAQLHDLSSLHLVSSERFSHMVISAQVRGSLATWHLLLSEPHLQTRVWWSQPSRSIMAPQKVASDVHLAVVSK